MYTLVIYDITNDEVRSRVAKACKEAGLVRIQKSAFLGRIDSQIRKHLKRRLMRLIHREPGNIQIFLICEGDMRFREIIGEADIDDEDIIIL